MGNKISGHRILKIKENSPASGLLIEPMIDFLLYPPPDTDVIEPNFYKYIQSNEDKEIELTLFNIASQKIHKCKITPRKWEGEGLLGFLVHEENHSDAHLRVIHVLELVL